MKRWLSALICLLLLPGACPALAQESLVNEADMAAYAACVNTLAVEYGVPTFLWDCSVHVNRKELKVNYPAYVEAIMGCYPHREAPGNGGDPNVFEEESAAAAAARFGPGINLGNTLDATSYSLAAEKKGEKGWIVQWGARDREGRLLPSAFETAWGQPLTTAAIADYIVSLGFGAVRIPVTWAEHMDPDGRVDEAWMARVKEVVDLFHQRGLYVIINVHHDGGADGWIKASEGSFRAYGPRFAALWAQIARR